MNRDRRKHGEIERERGREKKPKGKRHKKRVESVNKTQISTFWLNSSELLLPERLSFECEATRIQLLIQLFPIAFCAHSCLLSISNQCLLCPANRRLTFALNTSSNCAGKRAQQLTYFWQTNGNEIKQSKS